MLTRRLMFLLIAVVLLPSSVQAQTLQLAWTAPGNIVSVAQAQSLEYRLYVNGGAPTTVAGVICSGTVPAAVECVAPLPAGVPTAIDTRLELTAKSTLSAESAKSAPFIRPPSAPTDLHTQ